MATWLGPTNGDDVKHGDFGKSLKDRLWGAGGDDKLFGGKDNDKLFGGHGDDQLTGGTGDDRLEGSVGHDTFIFGRHSGQDVVTDFELRKDIIQIAKGIHGIKTAEDVLKHATQHGHSVVIDLGHDNKIVLRNVDLDDLKKHPDRHFDIY